MSKELIVSSGRHETRVAILEDDQVVELFHEREKEYSLAGSIHKGRVTRVLPGMQSAFVDIGLERDAFLYVSDFFEDNDEYDAVVSTVEEKVLKMEKGGEISRIERPEPVRAPAETPAGELVTSGVAALPASSGNGSGPETRPQETGRDGRPDRGGRGRRGRRRRGGRGSGLPESKFFSPGAEAAKASAVDTESENQIETERETEEPPASAPVSRALQSDDFMVLPGESLAKYSASEASEGNEANDEAEPQNAAPEEEPTAATLSPAESALPEEHPLAGFGSVASWINPAEAAQVENKEQPAVEVQAAAEAQADNEPGREETAADESPVGEDEGLDAAEVAEAEFAAEVAAEVFDNPDAPVEEGPEPARIPTSLTAALREQGHRYPHRVSRRMRRKMRGSQQGEEGEKQPANGAPQSDAKAEEKTVAPQREERRAPEFRGNEPGATESREREPREQRGESRQQEQRGAKERPERERPPLPSISDLLKEGQEIIVQIAKEPLGQKGARITSHIALPGRFVVYMPTVEHVGVSRKIPSDEERQRLKRILQTHRQGVPGGFICRTAAENKSEEELKSDMHFLYNLWLDMRQKAEKKPAPVLLHHDLDLVQRILRDQLTTSFKTIWVDNEELYESILSFVQRFQPALVGRVKLYTRSNPIFDEFGITGEVEKALRPKVWLKSGGHIVINQTEALVAIDINTGKYVGKSNRLEDTIVKINTDAVKEIVRQIRLRDLGGIIVVDFIDMDERKNRQKVMLALEESMRADRAPYKILQFNDFGLVAITRKRVKQSLERTLCAPCTYCEGAGYIKSVNTVIGEILQEAQKMSKALEAEQSNLVLRVNPEVAKVLKSNQNSYLQEIEEIVGKSVLVKSDPLLHQTKFDLA
ncbi:MAG: Rne/Rng family ribonuclease [Bryobacteraceae bacterium]|jgi:ribonuclease G